MGKGERVFDLVGRGRIMDTGRVTHKSVSILKQAGKRPTDTLRAYLGQNNLKTRADIQSALLHRHNDGGMDMQEILAEVSGYVSTWRTSGGERAVPNAR